MCNCIKDSKEKFAELVTKRASEKGENVIPITDHGEDGIDGLVIMMVTKDSGFTPIIMSTQFRWKTTFEKKNGEVSRPKKNHSTIAFSYCPFCGEKYIMREAAEPVKSDSNG